MNIRHGPFACLLAALVAGCSPASTQSAQADQQPAAMADDAAAPARNATEREAATLETARVMTDRRVTLGVAGGTVPKAGSADGEITGAEMTDAEMAGEEMTGDGPGGAEPSDKGAASITAAPGLPVPDRGPADTPVPAPRPDWVPPMPRVPAGPNPLDLPPSNAAAPDDPPFPDEVTAFMVRRDGCDHFRGEAPYDAERRAYLENNIAALCTGTDAKLAALRHRYSGNPAVIAALSGYEDRIEAPDRR